MESNNKFHLKTYKNFLLSELKNQYDDQEIESFFYLIIKHLTNISRIDLALNPKSEFTEEQFNKANIIAEDLKNNKPIQYLLGKTSFFGLEFNVNSNVLIPRPETEELVEWILNEINQQKNLEILDIGTGSGAIAVSLAKNSTANLTAFDISEEALKTAQINADLNKTFVHLIEFDILNDIWEGHNFDIIVSNPPYVRELEKQEIKPNVIDYEPHIALFVSDENPLLFYSKIADFALKHLNKNGKLFFEINQYLGSETVEMLKQKGFKNIKLKKDVYQNDRMVLAHL